jgi:hypothetical protein
MPTSGLILTLDEDPAERSRAISWLASDPRISCGELQGAHLPVAAQTDTLEAGIALVREELPSQPGISFVHVVCVDFEDADYNQEPAQPPTDRRRRAPEESDT